jgi:hypothetical protein
MRTIWFFAAFVLAASTAQASDVVGSCNVDNYTAKHIRFKNPNSHWIWCGWRCSAEKQQKDDRGKIVRTKLCDVGTAVPPIHERGGLGGRYYDYRKIHPKRTREELTMIAFTEIFAFECAAKPRQTYFREKFCPFAFPRKTRPIKG